LTKTVRGFSTPCEQSAATGRHVQQALQLNRLCRSAVAHSHSVTIVNALAEEVLHLAPSLLKRRRVIGCLFVRRIALFVAFLTTTPGVFAAPLKNVGPPEILLTFDDGPSLATTPKVLDILDQHHIKAVFFVNGWHFQGNRSTDERARALLRETLRRGHAIGNHTIHHYFLCGHVYSKQAWHEIESNAQLIEQAIGIRPDLFRTPYGAHCKPLDQLLRGLGIKATGWDIDPQDWRLRDATKIEASVEKQLSTLRGRAIVLFHDVQPATVEALPHILDWIDQENARRVAAHQDPIKIINYSYLIPPHPLVAPLLDALGRILVELVAPATASPLPLWPALLAWLHLSGVICPSHQDSYVHTS
jgi:peptidoglycan/xylan/chitin deacetylase (PgdA/CDA1 family)